MLSGAIDIHTSSLPPIRMACSVASRNIQVFNGLERGSALEGTHSITNLYDLRYHGLFLPLVQPTYTKSGEEWVRCHILSCIHLHCDSQVHLQRNHRWH